MREWVGHSGGWEKERGLFEYSALLQHKVRNTGHDSKSSPRFWVSNKEAFLFKKGGNFRGGGVMDSVGLKKGGFLRGSGKRP